MLGRGHVGIGRELFCDDLVLSVTTRTTGSVLAGDAVRISVELEVVSIVSVAIGKRPFMMVSVVWIVWVKALVVALWASSVIVQLELYVV